MTNYQYNGVDINNLIQGYTTALTGYNKTGISNMGLSSISTTFTSVVNERPAQVGYKMNGTDISSYCIAKYNEITTSGSVTIPSGCNFIGVLLVGGGGGGGAGPPNTFNNTTNTTNASVDFAVVEIFNNGNNYYIYLNEQQGNYNNTFRQQSTYQRFTRFPPGSFGGTNGYFGGQLNQGQGQGYVYNNSIIGVANTNGNTNTTESTTMFGTNRANQGSGNGLIALTEGWWNGLTVQINATQVITFWQQVYGNGLGGQNIPALRDGGRQAYLTTIVSAQNSVGSAGQSGQAGSYVYILSPTNPGTTLQFTIGGGGAANNSTASTSGNSTSVTISGTTYTAGGGGLTTSTTGLISSYNQSNTATTPLLSITNSGSNIYNNYGKGGPGGNQAITGSSNAGQPGTAGTGGYARIYFYNSNPSTVYTGGNYATSPFGTGTTTDFPSQVLCIWSEPNFRGNSFPAGPFILLTYTFNYTGAANTGTYKIIVDDIAYLYFNGSAPNRCDWASTCSGTIPIINGTNSIQAIVYNTGGGVGFLASFFDSSNNLVAYTNESWKYQLLSYITPSASPLYVPVQGGLWTTIYNNNQYYSTDGLNTISSIFNKSYYYTNISTLSVISTNIVSNFSGISNINSTLSASWGFKSMGYVVPSATGRWTFALSADDVAQIWIGTTDNTSGVAASISPLSSSNILVAYLGGTISYTVTLNQGTYYPILIYWGQYVGGQIFNLTVTNPSSSTVTQSTIFYYVNAQPIY
jgi:hypothetical protein